MSTPIEVLLQEARAWREYFDRPDNMIGSLMAQSRRISAGTDVPRRENFNPAEVPQHYRQDRENRIKEFSEVVELFPKK